MIQTGLLKVILEKADAYKNEFHCECLCASHIAAAAADFCRSKYTGFECSEFSYPRFEEERLRYLFEKEIKLTAYFKLRLSQNTKHGVREEGFDLSACEAVAAMREAGLLSADVVFLCALEQLHESYRPAVRTAHSTEAVLALLQDADEKIYDYVIEKIEDICRVLKKKAEDAAAIRDWKPAAKLAEPETLAEMFFEKIEKSVVGAVMTLTLPDFFGDTDLKVSIHKVQGIYYIHDNGCAIGHLSKQVADEQVRQRILESVCHPCWIHEGRITDSFLHERQFLLYLKKLVFVAHAALYATKVSSLPIPGDQDYLYAGEELAEPLEERELLEMLKKSITFDYDENKGLYYGLALAYPISSVRCAFLLETLEDGNIRISDKRKGNVEGEIFELFYWDHDDLSAHGEFLSKLAVQLGGAFDGKDLYLTDQKENFFQAMLSFFNLAVLLSEFGGTIDI